MVTWRRASLYGQPQWRPPTTYQRREINFWTQNSENKWIRWHHKRWLLLL